MGSKYEVWSRDRDVRIIKASRIRDSYDMTRYYARHYRPFAQMVAETTAARMGSLPFWGRQMAVLASGSLTRPYGSARTARAARLSMRSARTAIWACSEVRIKWRKSWGRARPS